MCSWVGYEKEGFRGRQYLLEEGDYQDWRVWGGCDAELRSVRVIRAVSCMECSQSLLIRYKRKVKRFSKWTLFAESSKLNIQQLWLIQQSYGNILSSICSWELNINQPRWSWRYETPVDFFSAAISLTLWQQRLLFVLHIVSLFSHVLSSLKQASVLW